MLLFMVYPFWRIHDAKTRIIDYSQRISPGTPIATAESLAQRQGLKIIKSAGNDPNRTTLLVWDGWAFARWICAISYKDGIVVKRKVNFLD